MNDPSCKGCAFFRAFADDADADGECRRHAPRPLVTDRTMPETTSRNRIGVEYLTSWPVVGADDWCGEWQRTALANADESMWREFKSGLCVRSQNCLDREGIASFASLDALTDAQILSIRNFGRATLRRLRERRQAFPGAQP